MSQLPPTGKACEQAAMANPHPVLTLSSQNHRRVLPAASWANLDKTGDTLAVPSAPGGETQTSPCPPNPFYSIVYLVHKIEPLLPRFLTYTSLPPCHGNLVLNTRLLDWALRPCVTPDSWEDTVCFHCVGRGEEYRCHSVTLT